MYCYIFLDWRLFDDSRVTSVCENEIVSPSAYVLFYRRRGVAFNSCSVSLPVDNKVSSLMPLDSCIETDVRDSDDNVTDEETNNVETGSISSKCSLQKAIDNKISQVACKINMDAVD